MFLSFAGNKRQVERLMHAGKKDGMWTEGWVPPGGKVDLYMHLKNKLKGLKVSYNMESKFRKSMEERRAQRVGDI